MEAAHVTNGMRRDPRLAGVCYVAVIAGGLFAQGFVRVRLIVPGSAGATMTTIAGQEALWRAGLAVHLVYLVATIAMAVLLYAMFKPVQASMARLALVLSVTCSTIAAMSLVLLAAPLAIARDQAALGGLGADQGEALGYLAVRLFGTGFGIALLFFAGFCWLIGWLGFRSHIVPTVIAAAMMLAGVCYLVNSLAGIIAPDVARLLFPWILLPCLAAELAFALWLLVTGGGAPAARASANVVREARHGR